MTKFNNLYEQLERMTELINHNNSFVEEDYFVIYEGLIRTVSLEYAQLLLNRWFKTLNMSDRYGDMAQHKNVEIREDDTLIVNMLPFEKNIKNIKSILQYINNLGYVPSLILIKKSEDKNWNDYKFTENSLFSFMNQYDNIDQFFIVLEAKFDIEIDKKDWPEKLYHITRQEVLSKILKIGLSPRTESKRSTHLERIYFGVERNRILELIPQFKKQSELKGKIDQKFALLEIDPKLVNHLRLFDDPNYKGYGYYALVNVSPNAIKVLKENL